MKLPEIQNPVYSLKLPICKKTIQFRPYLVKEHKVLIMAQATNENDALIEALTQIMNNCIISDIRVEDLCQIDAEYYFYNLRARSYNEIVNTTYKCNNRVEGVSCGNIMEHELNLLDLEVSDKNIDCIIQLSENLGLKLKPPKFNLNMSNNEIDNLIDCIEMVFDADSTYPVENYTREELEKFIEMLTIPQLEQTKDYLSNLPEIKKDIQITCSKCGFKHDITVENVFSFLD
jgi:DNA-directed RNA polymerase subunit M/transcription elongation factor TFIIS